MLTEDQDENISILEEAAAIRFVLKRASLEKEHKRDFTKDEVSAYLLAEVQDEQDKEMGGAISRLGKMVRLILSFMGSIIITFCIKNGVRNLVSVQ